MGQENIITLGNDVVLSTGYLGNYSKRTGNLHQSLVISTLEYIPKEKGGKRRFQKNIGAFLEEGNSTLEVAKTLDKIGFFKEKTEEEKNRVLNTLCTLFFSEKKITTKPGKIGRGEDLGGKRTKKSRAFCSTFSAKTIHRDFLYPDFQDEKSLKEIINICAKNSYRNLNVIKCLQSFMKEKLQDNSKYLCYGKKSTTEREKDEDGNYKIKKRSNKILSYVVGFDTEYQDINGLDMEYQEIDVNGVQQDYLFDEKKQILLTSQTSREIDDGLFLNIFVIHYDNSRFDYNQYFSFTEGLFFELIGVKRCKFDICISAHKNIVDLSKFMGWFNYFTQRDMFSVRNCLLTKHPIYISWYKKGERNGSDRSKVLKGFISLRDSLTLDAPKKLRKIGEEIGLVKFEVDSETISNMQQYLYDDIEGFYTYAKRDSQISVEFMYNYYGELFEEGKKAPLTVASHASDKFKDFICSEYYWDSKEFNKYFRGGSYVGKYPHTRWEDVKYTKNVKKIMADIYYGGRNETFLHGLFNGNWFDLDMSGFYPVLASTIPFLDMLKSPKYIDNQIVTDKTFDFSKIEVGYAYVRFDYTRCKKDVIPAMTQKVEDYGLVYTLKGEGLFNICEIKSAYAQGCEIEIIQGCYIFATMENTLIDTCKGLKFNDKTVEGTFGYPFKKFFTVMRENRRDAREKFGKGSPQEQLIKLIMNSITGKLGQGSTGKVAYDIFDNETKTIPQSTITNPCYISTVTALGRTVISETMMLLKRYKPLKTVIGNVVTDGAMFHFDKDFIDSILKAKNYDNDNIKDKLQITDEYFNDLIVKTVEENPLLYPTLNLYLNELKSRRKNDNEKLVIVETKHHGSKALFIKTRMCILVGEDEKYSQFSMTGYNLAPAEYEKSIKDRFKFFVDIMANRTGRIKNRHKKLFNTRDFATGGNENTKIRDIYLNLNYDVKRDMIFESCHYNEDVFSYETKPFTDVESYLIEKEKAESFKDSPVKSLKDLNVNGIAEEIRNNLMYMDTKGKKQLLLKFSRKNYNSPDKIVMRLLCSIAKTGYLYYNGENIKTYSDILELESKLDKMVMDKNLFTYKFFKDQKIHKNEAQMLAVLEKREMIQNWFNIYYNTDLFEVKEI